MSAHFIPCSLSTFRFSAANPGRNVFKYNSVKVRVKVIYLVKRIITEEQVCDAIHAPSDASEKLFVCSLTPPPPAS
jgi:hypothetical protein